MKAPASSEKLQLPLPHPVYLRRIKRLLYGLLTTTVGGLLLFAVYYFAQPSAFITRWPIISALLLLLGTGSYALFQCDPPDFRQVARSVVRQLISPIVLGVLLILPALRLFSILALETDYSLPELLLANRLLVGLLIGTALLRLFQSALSKWVDRLFSRQRRRQEQPLLAVLSERAPLRESLDKAVQFRLPRLARLEAAQKNQRLTNLLIIEENEENHAQTQLLAQEHLNELPQRQEVPARVS